MCVCVSIILHSARWPEESTIYYSAYGLSSTQLKLYMIYREGALLCGGEKSPGIRNKKKGGRVPHTVGREEAGVPAYETETDRLTGPADGNSRVDSRR